MRSLRGVLLVLGAGFGALINSGLAAPRRRVDVARLMKKDLAGCGRDTGGRMPQALCR
jgi:hypothetical protein